MKQQVGSRGGVEGHDAASARGFSEDGDVPRITTELLDVSLNPRERRNLVLKADIRPTGEPQSAESVVDGNDHTTTRSEIASVVPGCIARSIGEGTTVYPYEDGKQLGCSGW